MNYAHDDARFKKVLIIASCSSARHATKRFDVRFHRFRAILTEAGFLVLLCAAESIARLASVVEDFKPDIVFSALDHLPANSALPGRIQPARLMNVHSWLEKEGIPYVGSSPEVIELALSKTALKEKWTREGVATPGFLALDSPQNLSSLDMTRLPPFPCIVKPSDSGNSRGITRDSIVFEPKDLEGAIMNVGRNFGHILIEHYLGFYPDFQEITCACVGNGEERLVLPAEIVFQEPHSIHVVTTEDKNDGKALAKSIQDETQKISAARAAAAALNSAGVRDYSRCDLAFAGDRFFAIEVNGQPMIPDPWFTACAAGGGLSERQYILAILGAAIERYSTGPWAAP